MMCGPWGVPARGGGPMDKDFISGSGRNAPVQAFRNLKAIMGTMSRTGSFLATAKLG